MSAKKKATSNKKVPAKKVVMRRRVDPTPDALIPASYNPREFDESNKKALKSSMTKFADISGITWNRLSGNIVTGHHRWEQLCEMYGKDTLTFKEVSKDLYNILTDGEDTSFTMRAVEWSELDEKAANVAANSQSLMGRFTADVDSLLEEIKDGMDELDFADLRFDDLMDIEDDAEEDADDGVWHSDIEKLEKTETNLNGIITTIKVDCPQELRSEIFALISKAIGDSKFSDKAKIK